VGLSGGSGWGSTNEELCPSPVVKTREFVLLRRRCCYCCTAVTVAVDCGVGVVNLL